MKALFLGLLLATPAVAAWIFHGTEPAMEIRPDAPRASHAVPAGSPVQVPVEVVAKGSQPEWVYVQVPNQAIPEPGVASLLALTSLLLLKRQRPDHH
jgi:hypothetical protein